MRGISALDAEDIDDEADDMADGHVSKRFQSGVQVFSTPHENERTAPIRNPNFDQIPQGSDQTCCITGKSLGLPHERELSTP